MTDMLIELGQWFRGYQYQSAMAIVATVLVLFGQGINNQIKTLLSKQHFIVRTITFILVCAFGYGLVTVWLTQLLAQQLAAISHQYIVVVVVSIFVVLGTYAQKQRHI